MKKITLTMPYYHNGKRFSTITLKVIIGFVDVFDGDGTLIYSGLTADAIDFMHGLNK